MGGVETYAGMFIAMLRHVILAFATSVVRVMRV
jgi:hypothetical protein